jgi:pilus assembly protein CpaC
MSLRSILAAGVALSLIALPASAGPESHGDASVRSSLIGVSVDRGGDSAVSRHLLLGLNKSAVIDLPVDAADVLVSNPEVANAVIRSSRKAFIIGAEAGQTNAYFFDAEGRQILNLEIRIEQDPRPVQEMIDRLIPEAAIKVEALNEGLVLSGYARSAREADAAVKIAQRFVEDPENVVSLIGVTGKEQVMLKVRIVEMQRTLSKQLGVELGAGVDFGGGLSTSILSQNEFSLVGRALGGLNIGLDYLNTGSGDIRSIGLEMDALERVGLVRTLAEPTVTSISGETANFLAGGEFPVPVGRDEAGQIVIEYKSFGVGLAFTPLVLSDGAITLHVETEVSELTNQGQLNINSSFVDTDGDGIADAQVAGLTLPGLNVRRARSTVEVPSGGAMMMAGLIQDKTKQSMDGVPGAKDVPGLGALFRSRDFSNDETELVVIVTPYLVNSTSTGRLQSPADGYEAPGDVESFIFGRLSKTYSRAEEGPKAVKWQGPVGFMLGEQG